MTIDVDTFSAALKWSSEFDEQLRKYFPEDGLLVTDDSPKHELAGAACLLALEHAAALRASLSINAPNAAAALLRLEFEAVLRAAWLLFAANADDVCKLERALDLEAETTAKKVPGYLDMLTAITRSAPPGLSGPLVEFNKYSRHALNSFVHSGIHPLHRIRAGFPIDLALKVLQFSNAMMHFAYRLLATLSGSQLRMDRVTHLFDDFQDCVPMST